MSAWSDRVKAVARQFASPALLLVAGLLLGSLLAAAAIATTNGGSSFPWLICLIALIFVALGAVHFLHVFTRDLPNGKSALRPIFIYAYAAQMAALALCVLPFLMDRPLGAGSWAAIAKGCVRVEGEHGGGLTRCSDSRAADQQWLLHIGSGTLDPQLVYGFRIQDFASGVDAACPDANTGALRQLLLDHPQIPAPEDLFERLKSTCGAAPNDRLEKITSLVGRWLSDARTEFGRGLAVPLYVIVLSLFGSAVGLMRRLPEIQKAATKENNDAISPVHARERVVFQIMQTFAAPLIAMAAFAGIEPSTSAAAALIGFLSGFSSEAVLKKIRQASDAAIGQTPNPAPKPRNRGGGEE